MNDEKFIKEIAREAVKNMRKTYEQTDGERTGTILRYKHKEYLRISMLLFQINEKTRSYNVGVSVDDEQLKENEVRIYYIDTSK